MKTPFRVTFRHIPQSAALDEKIREKIDKLARLYPEILGCDATVDQMDRHQNQGRHFRIAIGVRIPGEELIANTNHEDAYVALRNAFAALRRQLDKTIGKRRLNGGPSLANIADDDDELPDTVERRIDTRSLEMPPIMEEDEAVALLSGASRRIDPERLAENVEQY